MNIRIDVYHHLEPGDARSWFKAFDRQLGIITRNQELTMIDTSKLLAAVADEKTESASLRALVAANSATMKDLSDKLAAAIAANDPAAVAQVQADLDQAAADLSADNQAAKDAIAANTPPAPTP